jgi:hypothetical protein
MSARQLELFRVKKPRSPRRAPVSATATDWGLYVNECAIFASGIAADRWADFTLRAKGGRLTMLWTGPGGGEWHVMCGTKADAAEALETFLGVGFHKSHVKAARLSACVAKAAEVRRRVDERMARAAV